MIDSYSKFFEKYNKNSFFRDGLEQIIYVDDNSIEKQWHSIINKLNNNETLFIRGYGRDSAGTIAFLKLYKRPISAPPASDNIKGLNIPLFFSFL